MSQNLESDIIPPKSGNAKQMVIFLHGYGSNGKDLLSIGEEWAEELPDTIFLAPDAPESCEQCPSGFQWFSIRAVDKDTLERERQIETAVPILNDFIDEQLKKWDIDESNLLIAGFSQGAMMTAYTMPRRKNPCAGIISYSGMLIDAEDLKDSSIVKMPVLAIHGDEDDVVNYSNLLDIQKGFEEAGFEVETALRKKLAHGIDHFGVARGGQFAKEVFGV